MDGLRQVLTWRDALCEDSGADEEEGQTLLDVGRRDARTRLQGWSKRSGGDGGPPYAVFSGASEGAPTVPGAADGPPAAGHNDDMMRLPGPEDVSEFARLILQQDTTEAFALIERLLSHGVGPETIYLDLLAPSARRLGDLWVADHCSFTEVTIGLGRLQQLMHELSLNFQKHGLNMAAQRRVLLLPAPGNQHTFGLLMVAEFFRRAGWDVWTAPAVAIDEMMQLVQRESFPLVGFSVSCERHLEELSQAIRRVRKHGRARQCGVIVGGPLVVDRIDMVARVGADAIATDARQAASQAQKLLDQSK